jgi:hypothetical protein
MYQRPHFPDVGIVVEHHSAVGGETDVELDTIGSLGDGKLEGLD